MRYCVGHVSDVRSVTARYADLDRSPDREPIGERVGAYHGDA